MQTENSIKPNKFEISKHQNGKCTVLFYDNIIEEKVTDPDGVETTRYLYDMYEVEVNSRDTLAESIEANYDEWLKFAKEENAQVSVVSAKIEQEISELESDEEKKEFLEMIGLSESGCDKVIKDSYKTLNLISFLTTGEDETRAWTITNGTKAVDAAGKIHTDIQRGFIKAEIVSFDTLKEYGNMAKVKEHGQLRMEGKDYVMKDGDITNFKFNV